MKIILASSSLYRKSLLQPLIPNLECIAPQIDEAQKVNELPSEYVCRLALAKASCIAKQHDSALVIGSDQCGELDEQIITKPASPAEAFEQLAAANGNYVKFYTGLCLYNAANNTHQLACETYEVKFRNLSEQQITTYLDKDQPYDCAGSFKSEGLGITLFEAMQGNDPNTLIGLPLIRLVTMLNNEGVDILSNY